MDAIIIITAITLILLGFLVKTAPNLIAGYNTMQKEKKRNVDIKGLSSLIRNIFISIGVLMITVYYFLIWLEFDFIAELSFIFILIIGVIIILIKAQKYDHNKKKK